MLKLDLRTAQASEVTYCCQFSCFHYSQGQVKRAASRSSRAAASAAPQICTSKCSHLLLPGLLYLSCTRGKLNGSEMVFQDRGFSCMVKVGSVLAEHAPLIDAMRAFANTGKVPEQLEFKAQTSPDAAGGARTCVSAQVCCMSAAWVDGNAA
eukprot:scaffold8067_cov24-Tisochrysis_lutea.AAC.1